MPADRIFRPAIADLVPYEPGKPVEEVQRELGLERVVKLASNEGQFGPFPEAIEAIERGAHELNRYPDGGAYRLRTALAEKHGVEFDNVTLAAGADAVVMYLSLAVLDPGDEIVCGWPSFPSYVLDAVKMGAEAKRVSLTDHRYDVDAILEQVGERTKIVYLCNPNNPTGTMVGRAKIDEYFERVPEHVLTVLDEAYFEYVDDADYPKGNDDEIARRRRITAEGRAQLERACTDLGLQVASPPVANFVYAEVGSDARPVFDALLREGVIVRPLAPFGAPGAIRVTVGTTEENDLFAAALGRVLARTPEPVK